MFFDGMEEPDRTEIYMARDLGKLVRGTNILMRVSNSDDAPWRYVQTLTETGQGVKVTFLDEESVRLLRYNEPVEVGL
ncbi:hypothetical protein [Mycolicibacterium canariasense]|nr:hypothetical protein [Mycolicibacterium canariasense]MCV7210332.1 hypothetical protein [Mycolicibacterium canariasense]